MLIRAGLITPSMLDDTLASLRRGGGHGRLGATLVDAGHVNDRDLAQVLSQELSVPWVALDFVEPTPTLLSAVPRSLAERFCVVPVYIRRERRQPPTLYVATDDPTWEEALYTVSIAAEMPARAMIAPRGEVRAAIASWYPPPLRDGRPTRPAPRIDSQLPELGGRRSSRPPSRATTPPPAM